MEYRRRKRRNIKGGKSLLLYFNKTEIYIITKNLNLMNDYGDNK